MSKIYTCDNCNAQSPKWSGRCFECGKWGTIQKDGNDDNQSGKVNEIIDLSNLKNDLESRIKTSIEELDTVLGGGIMPGSLVLLGGEPGIGKSTLVLQILNSINTTTPPLYISGEESAHQIKQRMARLGTDPKKFGFLAQTKLEDILATIKKEKPGLVILDSIQTLYSTETPSESGSMNQIRACTVKLLELAKQNNIPIILIGHITKDGAVAGPKTLEHLVDAVMYLEGNRSQGLRILRSVKNRFGSTDEIGIFEMTTKGLLEVKNASSVYLMDNTSPIPGSVTTAVMEGNRPFLLEIQALVSKTPYGYPQRKASGFDTNRLQLLAAVLQKRANIKLDNQDIHINVVGGYKIKDTASDLAVCHAIYLAKKNQSLTNKTLILGEVGLGGEIRPIGQIDKRLKEAERLGFEHCIVPNQKISSGLETAKHKSITEIFE